MEALILAGGFATRMYPLTRDRAKPLLDVAGKTCLERAVEALAPLVPHGLGQITVVTNSRFRRDFERALDALDVPCPARVADNGVESEAERFGAVGDMAFGAWLVEPGEDFWVLAGDNVSSFDLVPAWLDYAGHERHPLVLLSRAEGLEQVRMYNNVRLREDGRIAGFVEKPKSPWSTRFAVCMYVFPSAVRDHVTAYLEEGLDPEHAGSFIAWLSGRCPVRTFDPGGAWFDIGSPEDLERARAFFSRG